MTESDQNFIINNQMLFEKEYFLNISIDEIIHDNISYSNLIFILKQMNNVNHLSNLQSKI